MNGGTSGTDIDGALYSLTNGNATGDDQFPFPPGPVPGDSSATYTGVVASLNAGATVDFTVMSTSTGYSCWMGGSASITQVPEPGCILALLCGVGGLAGLLRRRT